MQRRSEGGRYRVTSCLLLVVSNVPKGNEAWTHLANQDPSVLGSHLLLFPPFHPAVLHEHPQDEIGSLGWGRLRYSSRLCLQSCVHAKSGPHRHPQGIRGGGPGQLPVGSQAFPPHRRVVSPRKVALGTGDFSLIWLSLLIIVSNQRDTGLRPWRLGKEQGSLSPLEIDMCPGGLGCGCCDFDEVASSPVCLKWQ